MSDELSVSDDVFIVYYKAAGAESMEFRLFDIQNKGWLLKAHVLGAARSQAKCLLITCRAY